MDATTGTTAIYISNRERFGQLSQAVLSMATYIGGFRHLQNCCVEKLMWKKTDIETAWDTITLVIITHATFLSILRQYGISKILKQ